MKKETVKTAILSLLICLCVFLFSKIWFSEKLWSSDYNFFAFLTGKTEKQADTSSTIEDILQPKQIVFSYGGKRFVTVRSDNIFEDYYENLKTVLSKISEDSTFTTAHEQELLSAIKSASAVIDFGTVFGGEVGDLLNTYFPCQQVKDVVISFNDAVLGKPVVYMKDHADGTIYKTTVDMQFSSLLESLAQYVDEGSSQNTPYAFELGFNQSKQSENSEIAQDIILDSNILIDLSGANAYDIKTIPVDASKLSSSQTELLLRQFGMEKARKYIEINDDILFVSGNATLKVSSDGAISYNCDSEGPVIYEPSSKSALSSGLGNVFSYIRGTFRSVGVTPPSLQLSSDLVNFSNNTKDIIIFVDYYVNGIPVMLWDNAPAIEITLKNGRLYSFKGHLCEIVNGEQPLYTDNMLRAIDGLYSSLSKGTKVTVSDIFVAYTKENELSWCAKLQGSNEIVVINKGAME